MTTQTQDRTPEDQPAEQDPTTTPAKSPKTRARPVGWAASPSSPPPSGEAATDGGSDAAPGFPELSDEPPASRPRKSGSSRTSSPVDSPEHVEKAIRAAVIGGTEVAHELLVHDPVAQEVELLLADDDDADGVAQPGARLIARRLTSGINNPDLADGIELAIAVGAYVAKQLRKWREVRRARHAQQASLEDLAADAGEPAGA